MTPNEAISRLEELLVEERSAIRNVDGSAVEAIALEKMMLLRGVRREQLRDDATMATRFRAVATGLRNNAVILAHARNCLRDIVQLAAVTPTTYGANGQLGAARARRVSVTG